MVFNNVISLDCCIKSHVYLIEDNGNYTMIDTGFPFQYQEILDEIKALNIDYKKINKILLTHSDFDHAGNVNKFQKLFNCPVYCTIQEKNEYGKRATKKLLQIQDEHSFEELINEIKPYTQLTALDEQIDNFIIVPTPGHTMGHVCYKYKDVLFVGDLFMTKKGEILVTPEFYNENQKLYNKTLKNLNVEGINLLCPAHGKPIPTQPAWQNFINSNIC